MIEANKIVLGVAPILAFYQPFSIGIGGVYLDIFLCHFHVFEIPVHLFVRNCCGSTPFEDNSQPKRHVTIKGRANVFGG